MKGGSGSVLTAHRQHIRTSSGRLFAADFVALVTLRTFRFVRRVSAHIRALRGG